MELALWMLPWFLATNSRYMGIRTPRFQLLQSASCPGRRKKSQTKIVTSKAYWMSCTLSFLPPMYVCTETNNSERKKQQHSVKLSYFRSVDAFPLNSGGIPPEHPITHSLHSLHLHASLKTELTYKNSFCFTGGNNAVHIDVGNFHLEL